MGGTTPKDDRDPGHEGGTWADLRQGECWRPSHTGLMGHPPSAGMTSNRWLSVRPVPSAWHDSNNPEGTSLDLRLRGWAVGCEPRGRGLGRDRTRTTEADGDGDERGSHHQNLCRRWLDNPYFIDGPDNWSLAVAQRHED